MYPLDHVGIAVGDLNVALAEYKQRFGIDAEHREVVTTQKVEIAFLALPNTRIELLAPTAPDSTLAGFLSKRGQGLHHLCYRVPDIHAALKEFEKMGCSLIDKVPRPGAHNTLIAFLHPKDMGGVLTELCMVRP